MADESRISEYREIYRGLREGFLEAVGSFGLSVAAPAADAGTSSSETLLARLRAKGARIENGDASVGTGWLSPSCVACRTGVRTETFLSTVRCPHRCWFCFNPNQENCSDAMTPQRALEELRRRKAAGAALDHIALTGGEPLLFPEDTVAFFQEARILYPEARTRLYTSGWNLDAALAERLAQAGLDEVRVSVKLDNPGALRAMPGTAAKPDVPEAGPAEAGSLAFDGLIGEALAAIDACVAAGLDTMVEMPVVPGTVAAMKELLLLLDAKGVRGINLLELCFPFSNAEAFAARGLSIKANPYRVPYDYWYAGGLPIDGSEEACLALVEFALDADPSLGVHYCSLENKLTGQIYQQNIAAFRAGRYSLHVMDEERPFLRSAKAFASEGVLRDVERRLHDAGRPSRHNDQYGFLEFPLALTGEVRSLAPEADLLESLCVVERRDGEEVLRELDVQPIAD